MTVLTIYAEYTYLGRLYESDIAFYPKKGNLIDAIVDMIEDDIAKYVYRDELELSHIYVYTDAPILQKMAWAVNWTKLFENDYALVSRFAEQNDENVCLAAFHYVNNGMPAKDALEKALDKDFLVFETTQHMYDHILLEDAGLTDKAEFLLQHINMYAVVAEIYPEKTRYGNGKVIVWGKRS